MEGPPPGQGNGESDKNELWKIVTDHPDIFDTHIVTKLNGNDVKFFYDVNSESRRAIKAKFECAIAYCIQDWRF